MPAPRLDIGGRFVRLKETGKATFAPDEPVNLSPGATGPAARFVVCLSCRDAETRVEHELDRLRAGLEGCRWQLVAGDNGSTDSTPDRVEAWADRANVPVVLYRFEPEPDPGRAMHRLTALADVFAPAQVITLAVEARERPHRIGAFCVVATAEVRAEAAILIRALRTFHAEPVFVVCDRETRAFLKKQGDPGLEFKEGASKSRLGKLDREFRRDVAVGNDFHRVDCIAAKMDAWQWAIDEAGDAMFLDADILPVANLNDGFADELILSPHFHGDNETVSIRKFGIFNAGYLWTNNPAAPGFWRDLYRGRSRFFEQEGMALFAERFGLGLFGRAHNVGFWREPDFDIPGLKSFHVHMTDALDAKANDGLRRKYVEHRQRVADQLAVLGRFDLLDFIKAVA
ncbi:MAG: hypothetical protein CMO68_06110 [Verrucomicrobiales bacterium]|nr:hypothetical protein [Verrucomicrobiales bacterium]